VSILDTLAPTVLLIALGASLAHIRFLGQPFMADLNKLVFWIALPALLFRSASHAEGAPAQTWMLVVVSIAGTALIALVAWMTTPLIGVPREGRGTFVQAAFRANLAYIGIPVMASALPASSLGGPGSDLTTAVIAMVLSMAFFNILSVIVLQASRRSDRQLDLPALVRSIVSNPLLLSGVLGLLAAFVGLRLPVFLDRTFEAVGASSVPIALMCIGGSLTFARLGGRRAWIVTASLLKVAGAPILTWILSRAAGLGPVEHRIAIVFAACPTAAAAYVMARQMDGDEALASGSVALSTVLSVASLAASLWLTR
jgi:predicted permease